MAANEAAVSAVGTRVDRRASPPASQSKRDRKRQALMDRLATMNEKFQRDRDLTYRDQLQKIQFETNLVQRFDPYAQDALEAIADLQREHRQTQGSPVHAESARSVMDMAGIRLPDFISEVEDLIEIRDFQFAQSKVSAITPSAVNMPLTAFASRTSTNAKSRNTKTPTPTKSRRLNASTVLSRTRSATD